MDRIQLKCKSEIASLRKKSSVITDAGDNLRYEVGVCIIHFYQNESFPCIETERLYAFSSRFFTSDTVSFNFNRSFSIPSKTVTMSFKKSVRLLISFLQYRYISNCAFSYEVRVHVYHPISAPL